LYIDGHSKDFDVIGELSRLRELSVRGVTRTDLSPLAKLHSLESFRLLLGGTRDLSALKSLAQLRKLEISMVRRLSDLDIIADIESLENLNLSYLPRLVKLPSFSRLRSLKSVDIEKLPGLQDLTSIADAPALEKFSFVGMPKLPIDAFRSFVGHPTLKQIDGGLGSTKKNRLLKARYPFVDVWTESPKVTTELIHAAWKRSHDKRS
jgi:Leucine-rich repeat (LRR) protein